MSGFWGVSQFLQHISIFHAKLKILSVFYEKYVFFMYICKT
jgi:hypothetical protein